MALQAHPRPRAIRNDHRAVPFRSTRRPAGSSARLTMPVLAIAGALDVSDVAAVARHLEAEVPTARALVMPDVAHMIGLEAPDALARAILELVEPLAPW